MDWRLLTTWMLMFAFTTSAQETADNFKYKRCVCDSGRVLGCIDNINGLVVNQFNCKDLPKKKDFDISLTKCIVPHACLYKWRPQPWSQCSKSCGDGTRQRSIHCVRRGKSGRRFPEAYCQFADKPAQAELCRSLNCGPTLRIGNWSECSVTCGGGFKYLMVDCFRTRTNGTTQSALDCDVNQIPKIVEACNTHSCGNKNKSEDNGPRVVFAADRAGREKRKTGVPKVYPGTKNHWIIAWYQDVVADIGDRISAVKGTHLTLRCKFSGTPRPRITWIHNGEVIDYRFDRNMKIYEPGSESLLKIKKLTAKYNGEYVCLAANSAGYDIARAWVRQIIQGQATILSERKEIHFKPQDKAISVTIGTNITVFDGATVTFRCPVRAIAQRYAIRWKKRGMIANRHKLRRTGRLRNDLTVEGVTRFESGLYSCQARSLFGDDIQYSVLRVLEKTAPKIISKRTEVRSFNNEKQVRATVGDAIFVTTGTQVMISCPVMGVPKPVLQWRRRGLILSFPNKNIAAYSEGQTLVITSVTKEDADVYTCIATNGMGTAKMSSKLTVMPSGASRPVISEFKPRQTASGKVYIGQDIQVITGKSIMIRCEASGTPEPKVNWFFNGEPVYKNLKEGFVINRSGTGLLLLDVTEKMEGTYTCEASNYLGSAKKSSLLTVTGQLPPSIDQGFQYFLFGESVQTINLTIGDRLKASGGRALFISCQVSGIPTPNIIWKKDKKVILEKDRFMFINEGRLLKIISAEQRDSGVYECFATNPAGVARSFSILKILARASPVITSFGGNIAYLGKEKDANIPIGTNVTILAGKTLSLRCPHEVLASDNSKVSVDWLVDGHTLAFDKKVTKDGDMLIIRNLQMFDEGVYSCVVTNKYGKDIMSSRVKISASPHSINVEKAPPKGSDITTLFNVGLAKVVSGGNVTVPKGATVEITCPLRGSPRPVLSWWRRGDPIVSDDRYTVEGEILVITDVKTDDEGDIICKATSALGQSTSTTKLLVLDTEKPMIKRGNGTIIRKDIRLPAEAVIGSQVYVVAGMTVRLLCPVVAFPNPSVKWYFNERDVESNGLLVLEKETDSLIIPRISVNLEGIYKCNASNEIGSDVASSSVVTMAATAPRILKSKDSKVAARGKAKKLQTNIGDFAKVYEGQQLVIDCRAHGVPEPIITWKRGPLALRNTTRISILPTGALRVTGLRKDDGGKYTCTASNNRGMDSFASHVVVLGKDVAMIVPSPIKEVVFANPRKEFVTASVGSNITTLEGRTLKISCSVQGENYDGPTWYKYGVRLDGNSRMLTEKDGSLMIKDLRVEDAGIYRCRVVNADGIDEVASIVRVAVPAERLIIKPKLKVVSDLDPKTVLDVTETSVGTNLTVLVGKVVSLHCPTQGSIRAKVKWFQNGKVVVEDNNHFLKGDQVVLSNLLTPGTYIYSCKAETFLGQAWMTSSVTVVEPQRARIVSERGQNRVSTEEATKINIGGTVHARLGSRIDILCKAVGVPPPAISWFKDGQRLRDGSYILSENDMVLTIPAVKMDSAGGYSCFASNGIEHGDEVSMTLEVYEPVSPNFVFMKSEAKPQKENLEQWYGFLEAMAQKKSVAIRKGVEEENEEGKIIAKFRAHSPPVVTETENEVGQIGTDYSVLSGAELVLQCRATGTPKPFVTWRKEGKVIAKNIDNLVLSKMRTKDMGVYTCTAQNAFGTSSLASQIYVVDPQRPKLGIRENSSIPKVIEVFNGVSKVDVTIGTDLRTITGTTVVISCPAIGIPTPQLQFLMNDRPLRTSHLVSVDKTKGILVLRGTQLNNQGVYTCIAKNKAGQILKTTKLKLFEPVAPIFDKTINVASYSYRIAPGKSELKISIGKDAIAFVNSVINVNCPVSGFPTPRVMWTINDEAASTDDSVLNVTRTRLIYSATLRRKLIFRCTAVNAGGTLSGKATVDVIDPSKPRIISGSGLLKEDESMKVNLTIGENARVLFGSSLRITCAVTGQPRPSIMWSSSSGPLFFLPGTNVINNGRTLLISKVVKRHALTYKCIASNPIGSDHVVSKIVVTDTSEPQIVRVDRNFTVKENDRQGTVLIGSTINAVIGVQITIECHVSGSPTPKVTWEKDGRPLNDGNTIVSQRGHAWLLTLGVVDSSSGGTYSCVAENALGQDKESSYVKVGSRPTIQPIPFSSRRVQQLTDAKITVPIGATIEISTRSSLVLQCLAFGSPQPQIVWYKDNVRLPPKGKYKSLIPGVLEINSLSFRDEGKFTCLARNIHGVARMSSVISIVVPPRIEAIRDNITAVGNARKVHVTVGSRLTVQRHLSVSIGCPAYGHPRPKIKWIRVGALFVIDPRIRITADNTFRIDNVEPSDSGTYVCVAENIAGSVNMSTVLTVGDLPSAQLLPSQQFAGAWRANAPSVMEKHRLIVKQGEDVALNCVVEGDPVPEVSWVKDGVDMKIDGRKYKIVDNQLKIQSVEAKDNGKYCCKSINVIGETMAVIDLIVGDSPRITLADGKVKTVQATTVKARVGNTISAVKGSNILLICDCQGQPAPETEWRKNGKPIRRLNWAKAGDLLTLMNISSATSGNYTCVAKNGLGAAYGSSEIFVVEKPEIVPSEVEPSKPMTSYAIDLHDSNNRDIYIVEGSRVKLQCAAQGYPPPQISWKQDHFWIRSEYFDGIELTERSKSVSIKDQLVVRTMSTLTISSLGSYKTGMYSCLAHTEAGVATAKVILKMRQRPKGNYIGMWVSSGWYGCGMNCTSSGKSIELRDVKCSSFSGEKIDNKFCDFSHKPKSARDCRSSQCATTWRAYPWQQCTKACGSEGTRERLVKCVYRGNGKEAVEKECHNLRRRKPKSQGSCNRFPCKQEDCIDSLIYCSLIKRLGYCKMEEFKTKCCSSCTTVFRSR